MPLVAATGREERNGTDRDAAAALRSITFPIDSQISVRLAAPEGSRNPQDQATGDERPGLLAKVLRSDTSASLRRIAAWGLHVYPRTDVAVEALVAAVGHDADASVREMAAWALSGAHRSPEARAALVTAVRKDKDPDVHETAVWALGNLGDDDAVDALVEVLGDTDARLREMAAWSIGSCRPDHAPAALQSALSDRDPDVRRTVAWALYTIRDAGAVGALEAAMPKETDAEVRQGIVRALGAMGESSVAALSRLVDSRDPDVRRIAISSLASRGTGPWPEPRPRPRPYP